MGTVVVLALLARHHRLAFCVGVSLIAVHLLHLLDEVLFLLLNLSHLVFKPFILGMLLLEF